MWSTRPTSGCIDRSQFLSTSCKRWRRVQAQETGSICVRLSLHSERRSGLHTTHVAVMQDTAVLASTRVFTVPWIAIARRHATSLTRRSRCIPCRHRPRRLFQVPAADRDEENRSKFGERWTPATDIGSERALTCTPLYRVLHARSAQRPVPVLNQGNTRHCHWQKAPRFRGMDDPHIFTWPTISCAWCRGYHGMSPCRRPWPTP